MNTNNQQWGSHAKGAGDKTPLYQLEIHFLSFPGARKVQLGQCLVPTHQTISIQQLFSDFMVLTLELVVMILLLGWKLFKILTCMCKEHLP